MVLEDVAQAMSGEWQAKKLGTFRDAAALSFFLSKNLGAYTNDDNIYELA
ncbi:MAG: DegT/DnrJ/EryC1/StrS family aminotransferase [Nitrososphaeraceae archaeon]